MGSGLIDPKKGLLAGGRLSSGSGFLGTGGFSSAEGSSGGPLSTGPDNGILAENGDFIITEAGDFLVQE